MEVSDVAPVLRDRLGPEATTGLLALFSSARQEWTADVMTAAVERFERRLGEEISGVRVALAQTETTLRREILEGDAGLRQEMSALATTLRQEMAAQATGLRQEMADQGTAFRSEMANQAASLRKEMTDQGTALRKEIADHSAALRTELGGHMITLGREIHRDIDGLRREHLASRFELVKWCFVFWVGQAIAVAGIVGVMLRFIQA